jgi:alkylation response protein AidB-like acyl-CoA dehydrogenase
MSLVLTEEQGMLRDSARAFLADHAPVSQLRGLRDRRDADGCSRPLWAQFAEMGFTGVLVPEDHGGMGLGHVEAGLVMEEIGRHLTASPFLASSVVAATALRHGAAHHLTRIASGAAIATLAVDEGRKHDPSRITTTATPADGGWALTGEKVFVVDGHIADLLLVAARVGDATALFVVDAKAVEIERVAMVDAHNAARLKFSGVRVASHDRLGDDALDAALDAGRVAVAAELLGLADEAFARTVTYLKERRQFDRIIGEFQALQHRAAVLYVEIEMTRAAVLKAQQALDAGAAQASALASVAKAKAGTTATLAVQEGGQMHGGMGMTDEFDMGFFMKRARVLQELYGDASFQADRLARLKGY